MMWMSLEPAINGFRCDLGLEPIRIGEGGANMLNTHKVQSLCRYNVFPFLFSLVSPVIRNSFETSLLYPYCQLYCILIVGFIVSSFVVYPGSLCEDVVAVICTEAQGLAGVCGHSRCLHREASPTRATALASYAFAFPSDCRAVSPAHFSQ